MDQPERHEAGDLGTKDNSPVDDDAPVVTASRSPRPSPQGSSAATAPLSESTDSDATDVIRFPQTPARRSRRRRLIAIISIVAGLAVFIGVVFFSPLFETRSIEVQGARVSDPDKVSQALKKYEGVPMTRLSKAQIEATLDDVPQVKSVDIVFDPPHRMVVQLHERVGVAAVADGNTWVLVDSQGRELNVLPQDQRPAVPVVAGGRDVLSTDGFTAIGDVLATLPADVLGQLDAAEAPGGSSVTLKFKDGRKVVWGDAADSELKARVLSALVEDETISSATHYDVSAPLHPVTR